MWIRTAIKLPHDLGVCQKTVGNSAGDFHGGGERKTPTSWIRTQLNHQLPPVYGENHIRPPEKQLPSEYGFCHISYLRTSMG